jgi:hypothetical protein
MFLARAQVNNINPSIKMIDGKPFYEHTVLKGQTLAQIAEAYFSNEVSIQSANLGLSKSPSTGIKIPYSDASLEAMSARSNQPPKKSEPSIYLKNSNGTPPPKKTTPSTPTPVTKPEPKPEIVIPSVPAESIATDQVEKVEENAIDTVGEDLTPMEEAVLLLTLDEPETDESEPEMVLEAIVEEIAPEPAVQTSEPTMAPTPTPTKVEAIEPEIEIVEEEKIEAPELNVISCQLDSIVSAASKAIQPEPIQAKQTPENTNPAVINSTPKQTLAAPDSFSSRQSQQAIAELNQLSQSIAESLANLAKLRASIENPEDVDSDEPLDDQFADEVLMSDFLEEQFTQYFETDEEGKPYVLKEYFMVNINRYGRLSNIRDERTLSNNNTHVLDLESLSGLSFEEYPSIGSPDLDVPLGITMELTAYEYEVKIDGDKMKLLKSPQGFKQFPKDHPHEEPIMKSANNSGQSGKANVVIIDGNKEIATFKKFEYNPFGQVNEVLSNEHILRVQKMEF